jgi:hypothetical protein
VVVPQVGAAIGSAVTWIGGSTWAAVAARTALQVAVAYGASQYQARQVKDSPAASREVLIRSAVAPKQIVYGKAWVAGVVAYSNARPVPGTHDNYELFLQTVHAGHQCADITELMFDDVRITADQISWVDAVYNGTIHTYGHITAGQYFADSGAGAFAVQVEKHLNGERSPMLEAAGFNGDITAAHYMPGHCTSVIRFLGFSKTLTMFDSGPPTLVRANVSGKLIYDPRLDSSNGGSGPMLFADSTTWAWSDNPILCIVDYLTQTVGVVSTDIDWPTVITEANVCDELVAIPPATTEKRYTCNGVLTTGNSDRDNLSALLSSCFGTLNQVGGKWRPLTGSYHAPDVVIDQTDVVGDIQINTSPSRSDRYNTVCGSYFSQLDTAQQVDFIPVTDTTFLTRDNGVEIRKTLDLPMTNSETMCQRIAFKCLQQSDQMITVTVPMRWTGLKLTPGTLVQFTYPDMGWSSKVFRVLGFRLGGDAPVQVVMQEDAQSAWADPTVAQYSVRTATGVINAAAQTIPGPINFQAIPVSVGIKLTWTLPILGIDSIRIYASTTALVTTAQLIYDGKVPAYLFRPTESVNSRWYFWGVGVSKGVEGPFVPAISGLTNILAFPVESNPTTIKARPPPSATTNVSAVPGYVNTPDLSSTAATEVYETSASNSVVGGAPNANIMTLTPSAIVPSDASVIMTCVIDASETYVSGAHGQLFFETYDGFTNSDSGAVTLTATTTRLTLRTKTTFPNGTAVTYAVRYGSSAANSINYAERSFTVEVIKR